MLPTPPRPAEGSTNSTPQTRVDDAGLARKRAAQESSLGWSDGADHLRQEGAGEAVHTESGASRDAPVGGKKAKLSHAAEGLECKEDYDYEEGLPWASWLRAHAVLSRSQSTES